MRNPHRAPSSTYRLQIREELDLFAAAGLLGYLHDLGVDWVYLSPLLAAEPGSDHGYDVVAHDRIDAARGGAEGLAALSAEARRLGMGVLVDIVPNHVGIATPHENAWWWDLLTHGRDSVHAVAFDIDWAAGDGRVRIPVVGDEDQPEPGGPIANLAVIDGELRYHDQRFPLAPGTTDDGADAATAHSRQHYELVNWHVADDGLNYRRFFAVNTLAGVRVEDRDVFEETHVEIRRWFDEGLVDGLRVDHPDGLRHPAAYLRDLADLTGGAYVLVEKILESGELLPATWDTAGTTGYDALGLVDRVLTDAAAEKPLDALETRLRGEPVDWHAMVHGTKRAVTDGILHSEVRRIAGEVEQLLDQEPGSTGRARPTTVEIEDAVAELLTCFPVYRSYLPQGREHFDEAAALALIHRPDLAATLDLLTRVLGDPHHRAALRFQQTSGMVMAKGVEDCAFYRWSRLTSLNEVGGDPIIFAASPTAFHTAMVERQAVWPRAMTSLSTHDTKRGEDVRARITVLAELPGTWESTLTRLLDLVPLPDPGFGNLLWQAVLGAWPAGRERLHGYAEKAMREAGDRTTWTEPDQAYEAAVHRAVDAAFDDTDVRTTLEELVAEVAGPGWSNALAAKLIALTMPGVPDVYQGSELWEQSLVDPDNRRRVDFELRTRVLDRVRSGSRPPLTATADDAGHAKLLVTQVALTLRRDRPQLFTGYAGLTATGAAADHVVAFDRGGAITVATRLPVGLAARGGWGDARLALPEGSWVDAITGRVATGDAPLAELLSDYPVALLVLEADQ